MSLSPRLCMLMDAILLLDEHKWAFTIASAPGDGVEVVLVSPDGRERVIVTTMAHFVRDIAATIYEMNDRGLAMALDPGARWRAEVLAERRRNEAAA